MFECTINVVLFLKVLNIPGQVKVVMWAESIFSEVFHIFLLKLIYLKCTVAGKLQNKKCLYNAFNLFII